MTERNVRESVYAAENVLRGILDRAYEAPLVQIHGNTVAIPIERKFASVESIQRYVDGVLALDWVRDTYARANLLVTVRERKGQAHAHYERWAWTIAIPPWSRGKAWAMREIVVLHELAHHLDNSLGDHSPTFTGILVNLVGELIGTEVGWLLRTLYYDEGVKVNG